MSDPVLGERVYNRTLDSLEAQFGAIMEIIQELNDNDPGPQEKLALLINGMNAVVRGMSDVQGLRQFGDQFKKTGTLDPEKLKGREK